MIFGENGHGVAHRVHIGQARHSKGKWQKHLGNNVSGFAVDLKAHNMIHTKFCDMTLMIAF